jgi:hypothetical protein
LAGGLLLLTLARRYGDDKGYFGWRPLVKFAIPPKQSVTYVLAPPKSSRSAQAVTISVSWMGMYQDAAPAVAQAVDSALKVASEKSWYDDEDQIRKAVHETMGVPLTVSMLKSTRYSKQYKQESSAAKNIPVTDPSGVSYADYSDDIGILKVSTFGPSDMQVFRSRVEEAMHTFSTNGNVATKKLVLDLRSNGGGDICLGYALNRFLFPTTTVHTNGHGPHSMARYDMIKSALFTELAAKGADMLAKSPQTQLACGQDPEVVGYFTPCSWFAGASDAATATKGSNIMVGSGEWLSSSVSRTRGGVTAQYSNLIHEGCEDEYYNWAPPGAGFGGIEPNRVMLLSDGLCGSTCSVFSSSVQLTGLAKTAVVGGYMGKDQLFWSFPGGEVETIEFLVSSAAELGVSSPNVPQLLPDGATFRFAIREIYPWDTPYSLGTGDNEDFVPLEFVYRAADYRIYYNSIYTDSQSVFDQVVPILLGSDSCPAKGYRSPVTGMCGTCPPGSSANVFRTGCTCEYGSWSSSTQSCEWDSSNAGSIEIYSTVYQAYPAVSSTDAMPADAVEGDNCDTKHGRVPIVAASIMSFLLGVVATVVSMYVALNVGDRSENECKQSLLQESHGL